MYRKVTMIEITEVLRLWGSGLPKKRIAPLGWATIRLTTWGSPRCTGPRYAGFNTVIQFLADTGAKLNEKSKVAGQTPLGISVFYLLSPAALP